MKKRIKCLMLCLVLGFSLTTVLACNSKEKEEIKEGSLYKTLLANSKKEIKVKKEIKASDYDIYYFTKELEKINTRTMKIKGLILKAKMNDLQRMAFHEKSDECIEEGKSFIKGWKELKNNSDKTFKTLQRGLLKLQIIKINQIISQMEKIIKNI